MNKFTTDRFKNNHEGRMAFVVGSGPSLRLITAEQHCDVSGHVVIAVNGAILAFPDADYFVGCDGRVTLTKAWQLLKNVDCKILFTEQYGGFNSFDAIIGIDSYDGIRSDRIIVFDRRNDANVDFSVNPDTVIMGSSSAHCAMHIATFMGCSPIVLLGTDCEPEGDKRRFTDYDDQPEDGLLYPEGAKYAVDDAIGILGSFETTWNTIAEANPKVKIINCSGGRLEAFPRKSLDEVLEQHG